MKSRALYHRAWRKKNPDKVKASLARQRERRLAYNRAYAAAHPGKAAERSRRYRARKQFRRRLLAGLEAQQGKEIQP
jgi:hypothetical protein